MNFQSDCAEEIDSSDEEWRLDLVSAYTLDTTASTGNQQEQTGGEEAGLSYLLIEGIGKHAVEEDPAELERFRESMAAEANKLKEASDAGQKQVAVEAAIKLMAQHNETVKTDNRTRAAELNEAMRMMTETIGHVGQSSQAAVHQLGVIEKGLVEATGTNDLTKLRMKLGVCLKMIREQSESLKTQSDEHLSQLKTFVASSSAASPESLLDEPLDPVTGLPSRSFAENLLNERFARKIDCMVGVITVDRLNDFKGRYGQVQVDEVIKTITKQLVQRLPVATTLCRWSETSFIAVTDITSSYAETSQQWRKVGILKVEKEIDNQGRTAFASLSTSIILEHVLPTSSKRGLIHNLDRFVMQHSGEAAV